MQEAFADLVIDHLLVYVDDIILFASTFEEYLEVLEEFFARLQDHTLKLNVKKSSIYEQNVRAPARSA
ncbi:hypothetical protein PR001_g14340 [Phytophthora rubi]|uniref:Reverse transcriptase domain-containing protein n=1 Tax=Phytophthora rubi TaxID=129364 RepID=A0A6A3LDZ4_9STRA|nr:hypothetical protein PR001_g14340 [Phytophthora rubi]